MINSMENAAHAPVLNDFMIATSCPPRQMQLVARALPSGRHDCQCAFRITI